MVIKGKYQSVNGWVNLNKPRALSSFQAVSRVRRAFSASKAGHAGTLDPLATGVLPIALGEATKTTIYAMDGIKTYHFGICWGEGRTTDDREGSITAISENRPSKSNICTATKAFEGIIEQIPPQFSAIKVDGRRAYELARKNQNVQLKARNVKIQDFKLIDLEGPDHATFSVTCGKGTYVRSLARDLAHSLGTFGYGDWLRRIAVGPFTENNAISLDKIESLGHIAADSDFLQPIESVLADIPALTLTVQEAQQLKHGQPISIMPVVSRSQLKDINMGSTVCAMSEGRLVALARVKDGHVCPVRVINV